MPAPLVITDVRGVDRLRTKILNIIGPKGSAAILKANQKNADEFEALVRSALPEDPQTKHGHLADTIQQTRMGEFWVSVSIGDYGEHPYPLHLETGHRARDGSHVPGKAFWFPARRVIKKRAAARTKRAESAAIKAAVR